MSTTCFCCCCKTLWINFVFFAGAEQCPVLVRSRFAQGVTVRDDRRPGFRARTVTAVWILKLYQSARYGYATLIRIFINGDVMQKKPIR